MAPGSHSHKCPAKGQDTVKRRKGFIITLALVVSATLSLMAAAYSLSVYYRTQIIAEHINSQKAYYSAYSAHNILRFYNAVNYWWFYFSSYLPPDLEFSLADTGGETIVVKNESIERAVRTTVTVNIKNVTKSFTCEWYDDRTFLYGRRYTAYWYYDELPIIKWK
ncbi:MAG: hypothetical protein JW994_06465 [Candidatus Omnitrophica bacterium]|nr:hypothetical protein [Candidatus Omnitrophota bacterium]